MDEAQLVIALAAYFHIEPLALLDPGDSDPPRVAGVKMTGRAFRPVLLCAADDKARKELLLAARTIAARHRLK